MSESLNIVVLGGGPSAEREVSLRSSAAVARALAGLGHRVTAIDPQPGRLAEQIPPGTDVVFIALHGTYGEDGVVQAELETLGLPYTGCDVESSRMAFDKVITKAMCVKHGVPTAHSRVLCATNNQWPRDWQPPVVLKPVRQGSSVGLQFVDRLEDFPAALAESLKHDVDVLLEERILGREVTVGILGDEILPIVEIRPKQGAYDYQNKYTPGATEYFCPAEFDTATTARIEAAAMGAFKAVGARDYARVDIMVRADGQPVVLEVNTLPGMTETSLLPKAAAAAGYSFPALCRRMIELALRRRGSPKSPATTGAN